MHHIAEQLAQGQQVTFRPSGHSMTPLIRHKEPVTLRPVQPEETLEIGMIVLVRLKGRWLLHRVKAIREERYLIANARGHENGWASRTQVKGIKL